MFKTIQDIQNLKDNEIPESQTLDYKFGFNFVTTDKQKSYQEIAKDITGLANTKGGYLIYGVKESLSKVNCIDEIAGIDSRMGNADLSDWLNTFMTNGYVTPKVNYTTHKISIEGTDKIVFVLEIPESFNKPHMVKFNEANCYYTRSATSTKKADHNDVQNMFEFKNNFLTKFSDFKKKINIDEGNNDFGFTPISKKIANIENQRIFRFLLVNFTPYNLNRNINFIRDTSFHSYIRNSYNCNEILLVDLPNKKLNSYGLIYNKRHNDNIDLHYNYFNVYKNGAMEWCSPRVFAHSQHDGNLNILYAEIINTITILLYHQSELSKFIESEEWNVQISLPNVEGIFLTHNYKPSFNGFNKKYEEKSLVIDIDYTKEQLNDEGIKEIVIQFSDQLVSAFGLEVKFEDMLSRIGYEQTIAPFQNIIS